MKKSSRWVRKIVNLGYIFYQPDLSPDKTKLDLGIFSLGNRVSRMESWIIRLEYIEFFH